MTPEKVIKHPMHKKRRDLLRQLGRCINGPSPIVTDATPRGPAKDTGKPRVKHGPPVRGDKCQHCIDVHESARSSSSSAQARRAA